MADSVEIAKAYVQIVPSMEGAQGAISQGLTGLPAEAGKVGQGMGSEMLGGLEGMLGKFVLPAAIVAAVAEVGKLMFDLGETFDGAYDAIRTGTGATGAELDSLEQSFLNVKSTVPAATQDIADALAELNTRTGATGETLEQLTTQFMELDEIGYSMDIDKATGMFNAWGISADEMGGKLDELFIVSQSTGVGMDDLAGALSRNASSMKELGFSFEESAALAGQFDKAGLDASGMMSKLSKSMTTLAKDGKEPAEAFRESMDAMQGLIDQGDRAAAVDMASELFGTRGAPEFIQALETGALDVDGLVSSMEGANGAISENAEGTRSWGESLEILKNKIEVALEPLASGIFEGLSFVLDQIVQGVDAAGGAFQTMYDTIMANETVQEILAALGDTMTAIGDAGSAAFALVMDAMNALSPIIQPIADVVGGALFNAFSTVAGILSGGFKTALDVAKGGADAIKGALETLDGIVKGLKFELPHFDLPHFNISGGEIPWGIGGYGTAPTISVDWYATGGIVDGARLIGVGEAGPEAIVPISGPQMEPFSDAIADNLASYDGELVREVRSLHNDLYSIIRDASPDLSARQFGRLVREYA